MRLKKETQQTVLQKKTNISKILKIKKMYFNLKK